MQHEMAAARQQGEAYKKAAEDSAIDEQKLMEFNPQLYARSKSSEMMAKRHEKQENEMVYKAENSSNKGKSQEDAVEGVDWSSFSRKSYEIQMKVFLAETAEMVE